MSRVIVGAIAVAVVISAPGEVRADEAICSAEHVRAQVLKRDAPERLLERRSSLKTCASNDCPRSISDACSSWLREVDAQIPTVVVLVDSTSADSVAPGSVRIDGKAVTLGEPVAVDPGTHVVAIMLSRLRESRDVVVTRGDTGRVVRFAIPPMPTSSPVRTSTTREQGVGTATWISFGVGGVSLAGAGVLAVLAVRADQAKCPPPTAGGTGCADYNARNDEVRTLSVASGVALGIAAIAIGIGVWSFLSTPSSVTH